RRRRWRLTGWLLDLAACLFGTGISLWAISVGHPVGIITGLAGLAFSLFALALALGRKYVPATLDARTVAGALAWEISAARAAVRTSLGGLMIAAGALLFLLVCLIVYQHAGI